MKFFSTATSLLSLGAVAVVPVLLQVSTAAGDVSFTMAEMGVIGAILAPIVGATVYTHKSLIASKQEQIKSLEKQVERLSNIIGDKESQYTTTLITIVQANKDAMLGFNAGFEATRSKIHELINTLTPAFTKMEIFVSKAERAFEDIEGAFEKIITMQGEDRKRHERNQTR